MTSSTHDLASSPWSSSADLGLTSSLEKRSSTTRFVEIVAKDAYSELPLARWKQIRLLHLKPGTYGSDLCATLEVVALKDQPMYEALSYTWGPTTLGKEITIDGYRLPLTDNLWRALRGLRYRWQTRTLWVDALCINQRDIGERGQQVAFMGDIYRSAHRVCVWLGEPEPKTMLERISWAVLAAVGLPSIFAGRIESLPGWPEGYREKLGSAWLSMYRKPLASALASCETEWCSRAWTVQEFCLASKIAWCFGSFNAVCDVTMLSSNLSRAIDDDGYSHPTLTELASQLYTYDSVLRDIHQIHPSARLRQSSAASPKDAYQSNNLRRLKAADPKSMYCDTDSSLHLYTSLSPLIEWSRRKKATDPRDKVYSLRSFLSPDSARYFTPDYNKPCAQVFAEATYSLIADPHRCDIGTAFGLAHTATPSAIEGLPSWAIDFTYLIQSAFAAATRRPGKPEPGFDIGEAPLPILNPRLDSSGEAPKLRANVVLFDKVSDSVPGWGLDATGKLVEQELDVPTQRYKPRNFDEAGEAMLKMLRMVLVGIDGWNFPHTAYKQNLWRQPLSRDLQAQGSLRAFQVAADNACQEALKLSPFGFSRVDTMPKVFRWWSKYVGLLADHGEDERDMSSLEQLYWANVDAIYGAFDTYARNSTHGHSFFATEGGFLGYAPGMPEPGDVIALARGSNLPLILRERDDAYVFRGFAYVHGIMQGELERFWKDNKVVATEVVLE